MSYKPQLAEKLKDYAIRHFGPMETMLTCCFDQPEMDEVDCILTPCETCAQTYRKKFPEKKIINLLETIATCTDFPFPDYHGFEMSIQDTCATRSNSEMLAAIRTLLRKMNISLQEPDKTGTKAKCCGQVLYGKVELEKVEKF